MMRIAMLVVLVGCVPPEQLDTGPEVRVRLRPASSSSITNESVDPAITLRSTDTMYSIVMEIETSDGERERENDFERFDVTRVEGTASVPDVALPALTFMGTNTFTATAPITIPASAKGKQLQVTARGFDSRGLSSNLVDFGVALR